MEFMLDLIYEIDEWFADCVFDLGEFVIGLPSLLRNVTVVQASLMGSSVISIGALICLLSRFDAFNKLKRRAYSLFQHLQKKSPKEQQHSQMNCDKQCQPPDSNETMRQNCGDSVASYQMFASPFGFSYGESPLNSPNSHDVLRLRDGDNSSLFLPISDSVNMGEKEVSSDSSPDSKKEIVDCGEYFDDSFETMLQNLGEEVDLDGTYNINLKSPNCNITEITPIASLTCVDLKDQKLEESRLDYSIASSDTFSVEDLTQGLIDQVVEECGDVKKQKLPSEICGDQGDASAPCFQPTDGESMEIEQQSEFGKPEELSPLTACQEEKEEQEVIESAIFADENFNGNHLELNNSEGNPDCQTENQLQTDAKSAILKIDLLETINDSKEMQDAEMNDVKKESEVESTEVVETAEQLETSLNISAETVIEQETGMSYAGFKNACYTPNGHQRILEALSKGEIQPTEEWLEEEDPPIYLFIWHCVRLGATPERLEVLGKLIDLPDLDVNQANEIKLTPLHLAAWHNQVEIVKLLLEKGADPNAVNGFGKTALDIARSVSAHSEIISMLSSKPENVE